MQSEVIAARAQLNVADIRVKRRIPEPHERNMLKTRRYFVLARVRFP